MNIFNLYRGVYGSKVSYIDNLSVIIENNSSTEVIICKKGAPLLQLVIRCQHNQIPLECIKHLECHWGKLYDGESFLYCTFDVPNPLQDIQMATSV